MAYIDGMVEYRTGDEWYGVVLPGSLLLRHCDLFGCLFGVDNYGGFRPLFPDRGMPADGSAALAERVASLDLSESHATWVLWNELMKVDWSEVAPNRDIRISEYMTDDKGGEALATKWLHKAGFEWVEEALRREPAAEPRSGNRIFRRVMLRRSDALVDTDFPLAMKLMECLAHRFGAEHVRLVVWFE